MFGQLVADNIELTFSYDVNTNSYSVKNHVGLSGTSLGDVAELLSSFTGDVPGLDSLKTAVLESLLKDRNDNDTYELKLGAYRALQLLAMFGCDQLLKHMFSADSSVLAGTRIEAAKSISKLKEDEASYAVLYEQAQSLIRKSSYFNPYQTSLHSKLDTRGSGVSSLLKLICLLILYTDVN